MNVATRRTVRTTYGLGAAAPVTSSAGGVLLSIAPATGPAAPFVATAGAITELLGALGIGGGCGQTCITATTYANQAEVLLKQNLSTYLALATPRPRSAQQAALSNFTNVWNGLLYACAGVPGTAGQNCIGDRQQGACHFKDANGNCWNWWIGYHDPIANDTNVYDDTGVASSAGTVAGSTAVAATGGGSDVLWIAGAIAAGLLLVVLL